MTDRSPTLTDHRRAETQLEIATAAAELFAEHGAEATTAEDIARAAGVGLRTFYRYVRTKEEAVAPLLAAGSRRWLALVAAGEPGRDLPEVLERAAVTALTPVDDRSAEGLRWIRALLTDPGLRAVWRTVHQDSEDQLVVVLAARLGPDADALEIRLAAAAATAAVRIALESWAGSAETATCGPGSPGALAARCLRQLTAGLHLWQHAPCGDGVGGS
jgi:AcrR family transcriptional regulator